MLAWTWNSAPETLNGSASRAATSSAAWRAASSASVGELGQQDQELVAAEPGEHPRRPRCPRRRPGDPPQQPVAGAVAEGVVDELEVVEVDEQQRDRAARARAAVHAAAQLRLQLGAVGQPGQRVEVGEAGDLLLRAQALGDVLARREDADDLARRVAQQRVAPGDRVALAAAGEHVALVVGERLALAAEHALEVVAARRAVVLGDDGVVPVLADQLPVLVAEQLAAVAVEQLDGLVGAQDEQDRARHVEVVLRAVLGELALGDVDHHALGVRRAAVVVAHDRVALPHPLDRAVGGDQAVLAVELDLVLERAHLLHRARARDRPDADDRPTAPAPRPSARPGSRAAARSGGRRTRTATQAPTGPHTTPPAPVPPGCGSGDRRVRAPPEYAPRASLTGSRAMPPVSRRLLADAVGDLVALERAREMGDQPADGDVLSRHGGGKTPDSGRPGGGRELAGEQRAEAAPLQRIAHDDRELGRVRGVGEAHAAGDRDDRLGVAGEARRPARCGRGRRPRSGSAARPSSGAAWRRGSGGGSSPR